MKETDKIYPADKGEEELLHNVRHILQEARAKVIHHVNSTLVRAYWQVGKYIVEYEQQGTDRAGYGNYLLGYVVDNEGYIDFPILGKIKASGLSRWQLQEQITQALAEKKMLTDGLVTVEFMNFKVSILGEVTNPGTYTINSDKVTVLEAIAMAKDLTIFGERDHVYIIREENGQRKSYQLDLRSADIFKSPAYYLKQNDVVYVQPNSVRAGQSTINQNAMKSVSLWISIASLLTSIGVLVVNIAKD